MSRHQQEYVQRTLDEEPSVMLPPLADLLVDNVDALLRSHQRRFDVCSRKIPDQCRIVQAQGANAPVQALCFFGSRVVLRCETDVLLMMGEAEAGTLLEPSRFGARWLAVKRHDFTVARGGEASMPGRHNCRRPMLVIRDEDQRRIARMVQMAPAAAAASTATPARKTMCPARQTMVEDGGQKEEALAVWAGRYVVGIRFTRRSSCQMGRIVKRPYHIRTYTWGLDLFGVAIEHFLACRRYTSERQFMLTLLHRMPSTERRTPGLEGHPERARTRTRSSSAKGNALRWTIEWATATSTPRQVHPHVQVSSTGIHIQSARLSL